MPEATDNFAIQYPCEGTAITCADFTNFASSSDAALSTVWTNATAALEPPAARVVNDNVPQNLTAGVTATVSYELEVYDTANFWNSATPTIFTLPVNGTYLISFKMIRGSLPTTLTSFRQAILLGGVEVAWAKDQYALGGPAVNQTIVHMIPSATAGQQVTTTLLFTGSGAMFVYCMVSISLMSTT